VHRYLPLFTLMTVKYRRRGRGEAEDMDGGAEADTPLVPYLKPWGKLENGFEPDEDEDEDEDV